MKRNDLKAKHAPLVKVAKRQVRNYKRNHFNQMASEPEAAVAIRYMRTGYIIKESPRAGNKDPTYKSKTNRARTLPLSKIY